MKSIEASGKTVEDAVRAGLKELGCDSADVNIDVLEMGSPGLFGMFGRLAKVRLTVKEEDTSFDIEMPVMSLNAQPVPSARPARKERPVPVPKPRHAEPARPASTPAPAPRAEEPAPIAAESVAPVEKKEEPQERPTRIERAPRRPRPETPREQPVHEPLSTVQQEEFPPLDLESMGECARCAYEFLSNATKMMGVNVEIRMKEAENQLWVQMSGDTLGVLIGRRGETLDALQYLTSLQVNKNREDYTRVSLDTEHYRAKREDALRKLAARMASRVRKTGHRVALEPMNPYERRVLHSALQGNPYVTTHSEGEEPYRRVVITLK